MPGYTVWTRAEIDLLSKIYANYTMAELRIALPRHSKASIYSKAISGLGLKKSKAYISKCRGHLIKIHVNRYKGDRQKLINLLENPVNRDSSYTTLSNEAVDNLLIEIGILDAC
jgi:hypothetical protein